MPPRQKAVPLTPEQMLQQLASGIKKQARTPNIHGYLPHAKQKSFHESRAKKRLYIGGNRSGKTTAGVAEGIFYLRGDHPFKEVPEPPVYGRVIGVDFLRGVQSILIPQYKRWLPPSLLVKGSWERSYHAESKTLTLANGSTLEFMSYEQDTDKFAGVPRHFTHYDEEPPYHIYNECQARLIDYNGDAWFTMTPVEGMTWVYDTLFLPGSEGTDPNILVVQADMTDNPYISQEGQANFLSTLSEEDRKQRQEGNFVSLGGLVFKEFDARNGTHILPGGTVPPGNWEWYCSVDFGYNNPTAWLWHAVSPDGEVITFDEHYEREMTAAEHAKVVNAKNAEYSRLLGKAVPDIIVGDPAGAQRNQATGTSIITEYSEHGIYIMPGNNDVLVGVNQMQQYLRVNPATGKPYWRITENCNNLIREMERLRWATFAGRKAQFDNNRHEKIHKKDDHAPDSARYFMCCLPDLRPQRMMDEEKLTLDLAPGTRYDELLAHSQPPSRSNNSSWHIWEGTDSYALESD